MWPWWVWKNRRPLEEHLWRVTRVFFTPISGVISPLFLGGGFKNFSFSSLPVAGWIPGQMIATSSRRGNSPKWWWIVTEIIGQCGKNGGLVRESPQRALNSDLGIIVICLDGWSWWSERWESKKSIKINKKRKKSLCQSGLRCQMGFFRGTKRWTFFQELLTHWPLFVGGCEDHGAVHQMTASSWWSGLVRGWCRREERSSSLLVPFMMWIYVGIGRKALTFRKCLGRKCACLVQSILSQSK